MTAQIALPLPWPADGGERFLVTPSNAAAARLVERWREWPVHAALLAGPRRSGRSTLARLFREHSGGTVIEDVEQVAQATLFHAWNDAQAGGVPLLLVAAALPPSWAVTLPDLRTRLAASPAAAIAPPDDALVRLLLEEGFARRHLDARAELIDWLAPRVERSHAAVEDAVAAIDAAATHRRPSVSLARHVLGL